MNLHSARGSLYALITCVTCTVHGGAANEVAKEPTVKLRVVAQPLDEAMQEFSRQSRVQVVFFSRVAEGLRSPGANGSFTLSEALKTLLAGSGLSYRIVNARTVEIFRNE